MVARGDLGMEVDLYKVPMLTKEAEYVTKATEQKYNLKLDYSPSSEVGRLGK